MPIVVHIADARTEAAIRRSGLRLGESNPVIYFMPVMENYVISHQWNRELRRNGVRNFVGIYVRPPQDAMVWAGKYNEQHRQLPLGRAMSELMALPDPLGFEMFIDRKISPSEIHRIKPVPRVVGWRYMPHAHGRGLCGCPVCLPKGSIKSRALRERLEPIPKRPGLAEAKQALSDAESDDDIAYWLWALRDKRRAVSPDFLLPLMESASDAVLEELVATLPYFRHPESRAMLARLTAHPAPSVSAAAHDAVGAMALGRTSLAGKK